MPSSLRCSCHDRSWHCRRKRKVFEWVSSSSINQFHVVIPKELGKVIFHRQRSSKQEFNGFTWFYHLWGVAIKCYKIIQNRFYCKPVRLCFLNTPTVWGSTKAFDCTSSLGDCVPVGQLRLHQPPGKFLHYSHSKAESENHTHSETNQCQIQSIQYWSELVVS